MRKILLCAVLFLTATANAQVKDKSSELDSVLRHWEGLAKFSGTVLVAQHGKIILHKGYGVAISDQGLRPTEKTLYITGGATEMFTSAVIFKLQEEGKLSLNDTITKYLPEYKMYSDVTIRHLLSHQSGIFDYLSNDTLYNNSVSSPTDRSVVINNFKNRPLAFKPGTATLQSASNYYLLGMIIEKVTNNSYYETVRKYTLNPLSIENSGFNFAGFASWDKAQGYSILNTMRMIPSFPMDSTVSFAAAGLFTNTNGLYKWGNALLQNKLFKKDSWKTITTEQGGNFAYGWETKDVFGKKAVGHTGETFGFLSCFYVIPEDSTIIILLSNDTESEIFYIFDNLASVLYKQPYKLPSKRTAVFLELIKLQQYEGRYEFENGMDLNVYAKDKLLWGKAGNQSEFTMLADLVPDEFFMSTADVEFRFIRDKKTNLVTHIVIRQNRKEQIGRKWQ